MAEEQNNNTKRHAPFAVRFAVFMLFVTATVFLPSTILLSVCLVPTLVAAIIDNYEQKTAWLTVGAMNMAGTVPVWFELFDLGHTVPAAFQLIFEPSTMLLSYGAAAVGWIIYFNVTPLVASMVLNKNERRLKEIDKRQKALIQKWGEGVKT